MSRTVLLRGLSARLRAQAGFALPLALAMLAVLTIVGSSVMEYTSHNGSLTSRSKADQIAFALAEAGINDAMAVLQNPANRPDNAALLCSQNAPLPCTLAYALVAQYQGGIAKWWGVYDASTTTWTVSSYGYARNPTGGVVGDVIRRITTQVKVRPFVSQPINNPAWNFIVALRVGTPGGCDMSLANSTNMQSPLYVNGNLCLNTPSQITGGPLMVRGRVQLAVNTNIGSSTTPVNEVHVAGGCSYKGGPFDVPCTPADQVWASVSDSSPIPLVAPTADYAGWYLKAAPGPRTPCTTQSGSPPVWDDNGVRDSSVPGVFNLTPTSTDYSCVTKDVSGAVIGQLTWDHTAKSLTVTGTMYIDGSACVCYGQQNVPIQYSGVATLYLSGTFLVSNTQFCGLIASSGSTCASGTGAGAWDPNKAMLIVAADGQGGQVPAGDSIQIKSSYFQGGLFASYAIELDTTSQTEGPMVAATEVFGQTVLAHGWPVLATLPSGAPGMTVVSVIADSPSSFRG